MDWSAVALLLAERGRLPVVLLNGRGELVFIAPAAERALGWLPESIGSNWIARHVATAQAASARWSFEQALIGALRTFEVQVLTPRGAAQARFEASSVGRDDGRGLLLVLEQLLALAPEPSPTENDYDYEVLGVADGNLRLKKLIKPGFAATEASGPCYEVLHRRSARCEGCPLEQLREQVAVGAGAGVTVRSGPLRDYVVTSARLTAEDEARVSVRRLPTTSLAAVMRARLDDLAERARLSPRERSVFGFLMDGCAVEEIASRLEISSRTVKFHQANLLQKLGADSRADLMRLVF